MFLTRFCKLATVLESFPADPRNQKSGGKSKKKKEKRKKKIKKDKKKAKVKENIYLILPCLVL